MTMKGNPLAVGARRAARIHRVLHVVLATPLLLFAHPALALYAQVKPPVKVGADCTGAVSLLAPKLSVCAIAGKTIRIWCPNGQMFEGTAEPDRPQAALARSLCNMTQVP